MQRSKEAIMKYTMVKRLFTLSILLVTANSWLGQVGAEPRSGILSLETSHHLEKAREHILENDIKATMTEIQKAADSLGVAKSKTLKTSWSSLIPLTIDKLPPFRLKIGPGRRWVPFC